MSLEIGGIPCEYAQTKEQIPSINPNDDNHLLDKPHIFLDEIMRQAADSEIIRISMAIREGRPIDYGFGKDVSVIHPSQTDDVMLTWADEVIVATNKTRNAINARVREMKGLRGLPKPEDKLIIKKNYWNVCTNDDEALVNGTVGSLAKPMESVQRIPWIVNLEKGSNRSLPTLIGEFISDEGKSFGKVAFDKDFFFTEQPCVDGPTAYKILQKKWKIGDIIPKQAAFGYAITAHSAQGSSWENILVVEESFPHAPIEHARWLYTALTRAEKHAIIVKQN